MTDYFKDTRSFNYKTELHHLQQVHIAGTGTCAFKMDLIPFRPSEKELKEYRGMSDIWFAVKANMNRIGIYAVPRSAGWMKDTDESKSLDTLYREYSKDTSKHCKILNKLEWL